MNKSVPYRTPAVSVVLPVRNARTFLTEALDSICGQTFSDLELIIVDGRSTDGSRDIADARAANDPRVRLVVNEEVGLVSALEHGRRLSSAPLIARMDADDIAHPERLAWQQHFLAKRPNVVAVGGQIDIIDAKGRWRGRGHYPVTSAGCRAQLELSAPFSHPTVMMRAGALDTVGGYCPDAYPAEDYDLWLRMAKTGDFANLNQVVLFYRQHGNSGTALNAHANAVAVALAFLRHEGTNRNNDCAELIFTPDERKVPWIDLEQRLPHDLRFVARAAYSRAIAVNGGVRDPAVAIFLLSTIHMLSSEEAVPAVAKSGFAFAINRAAYQLVQQKRWSEAFGLVAAGVQGLGRAVITDIFTSAPRLLGSALEALWMPRLHENQHADWRRRFNAVQGAMPSGKS